MLLQGTIRACQKEIIFPTGGRFGPRKNRLSQLPKFKRSHHDFLGKLSSVSPRCGLGRVGLTFPGVYTPGYFLAPLCG
jgi:hypothetical protein